MKVRAFERSSCLFFIPNRAKARYVIIVSAHNPPNCGFLLIGKLPAEISVKEKIHINFLSDLRNGHGSAYSINFNQVIDSNI